MRHNGTLRTRRIKLVNYSNCIYRIFLGNVLDYSERVMMMCNVSHSINKSSSILLLPAKPFDCIVNWLHFIREFLIRSICNTVHSDTQNVIKKLKKPEEVRIQLLQVHTFTAIPAAFCKGNS